MIDKTRLACPDCGGTRFGWTVTQVQFGGVYEFESGNRSGQPKKDGPYVDGHDDEVQCNDCESTHDKDDLELLTDSE